MQEHIFVHQADHLDLETGILENITIKCLITLRNDKTESLNGLVEATAAVLWTFHKITICNLHAFHLAIVHSSSLNQCNLSSLHIIIFMDGNQ